MEYVSFCNVCHRELPVAHKSGESWAHRPCAVSRLRTEIERHESVQPERKSLQLLQEIRDMKVSYARFWAEAARKRLVEVEASTAETIQSL